MCACGMAGEHMASPIIAFLAGAGTGFLKQRDVEDQRKRDDEDQQFKRQQREVWQKQQADADALNQSLKQAQAPAEVVEGPLGDQSAGPPVPAALSQGSTGQPAAPTFRMVAPGVNKSFSTAAEAQQAVTDYAKPEAMNQRVVAAYRGAGLADKALEMERNVKQGQFADLQFNEAQRAAVAKDADSRLRAALGGGAQGLSSFASESGLFGGAKVGFDTSKDGKVQFYTLGADGAKSLLGQPVDNTQEALTALVSPHWKSLDTSHYLDMLHRNAQAQRAQANDDRNYALNERRLNADISHRSQQLSIAAGKASSRGGAATGVDLFEGFDPQKALAQGQARAAKLAEDARANGKPLTTAQEAQIAQEYARELRGAVYQSNVQRQNEEYFAAMAKLAKTPEQVQAVRAAGLEQGMPAEVMARIDSRLAPAPEKPAGAKTAPASKQPTTPKPTVAAKEVGGGLPPAAASAGERLDKARADLAALRSSRAPSLKDGNAARAAHAQKLQAAQDALDAAEAEFQSAASPYVSAAHVYRRQ